MPVIEQLTSKHGFTAAEKELADYILENADAVSHMGIAEVAQGAYKSNATIIRLCRKTGSQGWRDFRLELVADLERARQAVPRADANKPFSGMASTASIMSSILKLKTAALSDCYASVSREAVGRFGRAVVEARGVIYYALGESYTTLYAFGGLMAKIGVKCIAADQYRLRSEAAFYAKPDDLALIVSYSGSYITELERQIAQLRRQRCKIAVITSDASVLDAMPAFDFPIIVPFRESKHDKVATFYAQTCIRYVLDCVYSVAFSQDFDSNLHKKDFIEMLEPEPPYERLAR